MKNKELNKISMGSQLQPNNFQTLRLFRWTGSHANQNNRASGNYTLKYFSKYYATKRGIFASWLLYQRHVNMSEDWFPSARKC